MKKWITLSFCLALGGFAFGQNNGEALNTSRSAATTAFPAPVALTSTVVVDSLQVYPAAGLRMALPSELILETPIELRKPESIQLNVPPRD